MSEKQSGVIPFASVAWPWAAGALIGGLGEFGAILGARLLVHRYSLLNPEGLWLMPLAVALMMAPAVLLAALFTRRAKTETRIAGLVFLALFSGSLATLLVLAEKLHWLAILVLSGGIALRGAQLARAHPQLAVRISKWTTVAGLTVSLLGTSLFHLSRGLRERVSGTPARDGSPNVVLLVLDTVRAWSLSLYGYQRPTSPFLAELAQRGMRFDRALSTAPWTLPSHASMFTGRYPHELSASWGTPLDKTYPTLAEKMSEAGYATAGVAANLRYVSYEFGLSRGFQYYRDYGVSLSELLRSSSLTRMAVMWFARRVGAEPGLGRLWAPQINAGILDWLDHRPTDRPFFMFANFYDAHAPYAPPAPFDTAFLGHQTQHRDPSVPLRSTAQLEELRAAYDASITYLDANLRQLFSALQQRNLLDNTVVIITADHGEEFFEHGVMDHGGSLYMASVHVPLIISWPGHIPAGVISQPVTLRDIPATVLDLTGISNDKMPGRSLATLWRTESSSGGAPSAVLSELEHQPRLPIGTPVAFGSMKALVLDSLRFIGRGDGFAELFNVQSDPRETRQLAKLPEFSASRARFSDSLARIPDFRKR